MFAARKLHAAAAAALLALAAPAAAQVDGGDDDRLLALTRVEELQKEVRELTNRVETLEYELGRERKRRDELYRGMQARIDELEGRLGVMAAGDGVGLKRSHYSRAVTAFRDFLGDYPDTELSDDAAYWIAEAHYVTRSFADALQGFQLMRRRYPASVRVPDATLKVGYIQYEIGAYTDARATFTSITTDYPGSRVAISAKTRLQKMDRQGL